MVLTSKNISDPEVKLFIPNDSKQSVGGGWTFRRNLIKAISGKLQIVESVDACNVMLITSPTMIAWDTFNRAKQLQKKIVLRLDNVPRNSRNRNTGTSRLKGFAQGANMIIYQSEWARGYLRPFVEKDGPVIYNGVDLTMFTPRGDRYDFNGNPVYMYSRFNRDETKRWEKAWYRYQMIQRDQPKAKLIIVGNFSNEQIEYNFDFFMNENFEFKGVVEDRNEMAKILRSCDYLLATYYNDCYSNTYCEALACGVKLFEPDLSGGTKELVDNGPISIEKMANNYLEEFKRVLRR